MTLRLIGALLIIIGCGSIGFIKASSHRREANALNQLLYILDYIEKSVQYHLLPLPEICRNIETNCNGNLCKVFLHLADELDGQISPNVENCMEAVLSKCKNIPHLTRDTLKLLGQNLGQFGLEGQLKGIAAVRMDCEDKIKKHTNNQEGRLRTYQTLALCAGAAMAILFI